MTLAVAQPSESVSSEAILMLERGEYQETSEKLAALPNPDPFQLRLLIEAHDSLGQFDQAQGVARRLLRFRGSVVLPGDKAQVAYALWYLQRWEDANQVYIEASEETAPPLSLFVDWGNLYLEKFNPGEAESIFGDGLKAKSAPDPSPRWGEADALLGLSKSYRDQSKSGPASQTLDAAISLEPENIRVLAYQATLALQEEDWKRAVELLEQGFEKAPGSLELLELQCALTYFTESTEEFEKAKQEVLKVNPRDGGLYELLGDLSVTKRRQEEAVEFYAKAFELDSSKWSALASKGINLLRLGREEEGIAALEESYAGDPYNIWTVNTLRLLDSLDRFRVYETPHFKIRLHQKEAEALRPYVEDLLETSFVYLQERYAHQVEGKVVFEMYTDHEDFAVRTLGMPGLGALGATFGRVVAMDSPSARPKGQFHWASTLRHEVAHVVTLSMSNTRVPRWFTEGLSMVDERAGGPGWGDDLSIAYIRAWEGGELLPLADLNSGFVRPKSGEQLSLSYLQAGWVCEYLEETFGMERIRDMLIQYGEGKATDEVFKEVLGKTVEEVDADFNTKMDQQLKPLAERLEEPAEPLDGREALEAALLERPDSYLLNLETGRTLISEDQQLEAVPYLRKAIELFPQHAGPNSPYPLLVRVLLDNGEEEEAIRVLQAWWHRAPLSIENAFQLSELLRKYSRLEEAAQTLEEALFLDPLSPELHQNLGTLYMELGKTETAVREFKVLLTLNPVDRANAHYNLAKALSQTGQPSEARRQVLLSLEIAPGFDDAQRLLLELVRQ
jgi:tetratricopeptide (TPR) repeat protein